MMFYGFMESGVKIFLLRFFYTKVSLTFINRIYSSQVQLETKYIVKIRVNQRHLRHPRSIESMGGKSMTRLKFALVLLISILLLSQFSCKSKLSNWQIAEGPLLTRWATEITLENVLPEYPRPQLVRDKWLNLNGLWEYKIIEKGSDKNGSCQHK
jgi:hypothetical protein